MVDWKNKEEVSLYNKRYRETHKEEFKLYGKQYREENRDKMKRYREEHKEEIRESDRKYARKYRLKHREEIKKQQREYYFKNKERLNARMKKYRRDNTDKLKEYFRQLAIRDREKIRIRKRKQIANRRKKDISFRLKDSLGSRLRIALKKETKSDTTMSLIGCSREYLIKHLESKFTLGMNWKNYGYGWHIDHIIPCSKFDLSKEEEQKRCFHYSNLQPLWATENLSKRFEDKEIVEAVL